jgi:pyridoxal/pyridoxine/pyridoxamine kinase
MQQGNQTSSSSVSNSMCDARVRARDMTSSRQAHGVGDIISNMLYFPLRIPSSCDSILQSVGHLVRRYLTHRNMEDIIMIPRALE